MNEVSSLFRPEKNWGFQICSDYGFQKSGKPKVQNSGLDSSGQPNQQKKKEKKKDIITLNVSPCKYLHTTYFLPAPVLR